MSLLVAVGDRDVLNAHKTAIGPHRDRTQEKLLNGAHIINMDLVTFVAGHLPVTEVITMCPTGTIATDRIIGLQFFNHLLFLIFCSSLEPRTILNPFRYSFSSRFHLVFVSWLTACRTNLLGPLDDSNGFVLCHIPR